MSNDNDPPFEGDLELGRQLRDEGMEQAEEALALRISDYKKRFAWRLHLLAVRRVEFTSEDVTSVVGFPTDVGAPSNAAIGALINGAAKQKKIERVGFRQARRPNQHATVIAVWRGRS